MLTPLEIENKKFSKQMMNGYNVEEIDDFLDLITVDYEKLYKEVSELKAKISEMEESVSHYKTIESTLQNTLVMAQSTADEIKKIATQQAEQIIRDAELSAKEAIATLKTERIEETKRFEDLRKQFDVYKAKMEALLISQLELLKENISDYEIPEYGNNTNTMYNDSYDNSATFNDSYNNEKTSQDSLSSSNSLNNNLYNNTTSIYGNDNNNSYDKLNYNGQRTEATAFNTIDNKDEIKYEDNNFKIDMPKDE